MNLTLSKKVKRIYNSNTERPSNLSVFNSKTCLRNKINLLHIESNLNTVNSKNRRVIERVSKYIWVIYNYIIKLKSYEKVYLSSFGDSKNIYMLHLNFKKNRFFPYLYNKKYKDTLVNNSLGIISKRFSSKKSFLKSKVSYLMSASYLRRILIYINLRRTRLIILKTPKYLKDVLNTLMRSTNVLYSHPFHKDLSVSEKGKTFGIYFEYLNFINNKPLGPIKRKKRGRLKRKITKKVILYNRVSD